MSHKLLATVLFTMLTFSSSSCTDTKSAAGQYLASHKAGAESGDLEAGQPDASEEETGGEGDSTGEEETGDAMTGEDPAAEPGDEKETEKPADTEKPKDPEKPAEMDKPKEPEAPKASTYAEMNTKFFAKYCVECHGTKGGITLDSYANVKKNIVAVKKAAIDDKVMPKNDKKPTADELKLLSDWIAAGTPE